MTRRSIIVGIWQWWSSTHLVQCGSVGPSWTWTQIWVQAHMPYYSLNWTARSSAIHGWQSCQWCSSSTRKRPSRNRGPFDLKSVMEQSTVRHGCQTARWIVSEKSKTHHSLSLSLSLSFFLSFFLVELFFFLFVSFLCPLIQLSNF